MKKFKLRIGDQWIEATYDEWEDLFDRLEVAFGMDAVELTEEEQEEFVLEIFGQDKNINN